MHNMASSTSCFDVFVACSDAIRKGELIHRANRQDKEFHFQNWFQDRLKALKLNFDPGGRNAYPDFSLVDKPEGFEVKGLGYPGREANYDANSQVPSGSHNGRAIYYIFGRYPSNAEEDQYPVIDLVVCHGDFLNIDHEYTHKNRSVRGFGSFGDLMIRDRKMYVVPTPFALTEGTSGQQTLLLPDGLSADSRFEQVGELVRTECARLVVGYHFDLRTNELGATTAPNPNAGKKHTFRAWRLCGGGTAKVSLRPARALPENDPEED